MKRELLVSFFVLGIVSSSFAIQKYTFTSKDTYWDVAGTFYGNNKLYPAIQVFNNITDPINIKSGTVLLIPDKADAEAICNESDSTKRAELVASIKSKSGLSTDTSTDESGKENEKKEAKKYVAPTAEDTSFETLINGDVSSKGIESVSDSMVESSSDL